MPRGQPGRGFESSTPLGRGFGKGFVAGGILGVSIGVAAFALVPALVLAVLSLGVGLWFYRKIAVAAKTFRDVGP